VARAKAAKLDAKNGKAAGRGNNKRRFHLEPKDFQYESKPAPLLADDA
jgi:hypothetical protein